MVGMAFGAWLVMKFGALYPQNLNRAVLINSSGIVGIRLMYLLPLIPKILFMTDERARELARHMLAPPDVNIDDATAEFLYLVLKHFKSTNEAPPLSDAQLSAFQAKTLLLVSEFEDVFDVGKLIARTESKMANVTTEIIPRAPHAISLTHADEVNQRIVEFITR
ncbi:MAG: alpha/beta hydrolase [Chloroflexi bacterium]|nr:MAG: alpha/beta hydrolase [Chloroflexota bacterium]MBL1195741.1 alpha/beta hydrolase [Chloroflexota bacterium]